MPPPDAGRERQVLRWSIVVTGVLGGFGIAWGILTGSQMILLDGVYAFVGILVSSLLLLASLLAEAGPTRRYPYGREAATPLVIGVQGFVMVATLGYAAVEAVLTIREGGSDVTAGWAIAYGALVTAASLVTAAWLTRAAGESDLLTSEATAWRVAAYRGVGMVVGFSLMALLASSAWDAAVPYIDPAMVLITCVAFLGAPLRMVRTTVIELMEGAPPAEVQEPVRAAVGEVRELFDLSPPDIRMTKVGPKLYVEVEGEVGAHVTVAQEHQVRQELQRRLDDLPYEVWLNLELLPRPDAAP